MKWIASKLVLLGVGFGFFSSGIVYGNDQVGLRESPTGPTPLELILVALPMAAADLLLQTLAHEGLHCLSAELTGANCVRIRILQENDDGKFMIGETRWTRDREWSDSEYIAVLITPKLFDLLLLGGFTALLETDSLPQNKFASLAVVMLAIGAEFDFAKNFFVRPSDSDMERFYEKAGLHGSNRVAMEILYGALITGGAVEVIRGLIQVFDRTSNRPSKVAEPASELSIGPATVAWRVRF